MNEKTAYIDSVLKSGGNRGSFDREVPIELVKKLFFAQLEKEAVDAYDEISSLLTHNGQVFEAAVPIVKAMILFLQQVPSFVKYHFLCILTEVVCDEGNEIEPKYHYQCLDEVKLGFGYFANGLLFENIELMRLHLDLLIALAEQFPELKPGVKDLLEMAKHRGLSGELMEYVSNNIAYVGEL